MQTARAGAGARRARSRPATKRLQLVGLPVVEVTEVLRSERGAVQILCHGAVSIRRVATRDGRTIRLRDLRGKKVLLWFFPKADTPGLTIEGSGFRDRIRDFEALG